MDRSVLHRFLLSALVITLLTPICARANSRPRLHSATVVIDLASLTAVERSLVLESFQLSGSQNSPLAVRAHEPLIIRVSAGQARIFVDRLLETPAAAALGRDIYVGFTGELLTVKPAPTKCSSSPRPVEVSDALRASLGIPQAGVNRKYYVVDFFDSHNPVACEHGQKVLEVARQTLARYGAAWLTANVIPVQADFFADKEAGSRIISDYIETFRGEAIKKTLRSALDKLRKQKGVPESGKYYLSIFYLQALYHQLLSRADTAIISTSIYGQLLDGFNLFPEKFYEKKTGVIMLTAASDDPIVIEDTYLEPIRAFWERRQEYGLAIIGAINSQGKFGMASRDGDGVTTVGPASGWAVAGKCFNPETDCGTSFATPFVASEILLATAYWESKGFKPNAREVITRLMLSVDISPEVIGHYAAGGIPRLEKLLLIDGTYVGTTTGQINKIRCADCWIKIKLPASNTYQTYALKRGSDGFSGLQFVTDPVTGRRRNLIFREELVRWEEVEVDSLSFNFVAANGDVTTFDQDKFLRQYKELFTL